MGQTTSVGAKGTQERYRSYLLRLWREAPGEPWRCHVHCVGTGQERRFPGLAQVFQFLQQELSETRDSPEGLEPPAR